MDYTKFTSRMQTASSSQAGVNEGLRTHMLRVYNYMAAALALTGAVAGVVASSDQLLAAIFGTPLSWIVMLAPLGFVLFLGFRVQKMSFVAVQATFWAFAAVMGLSLASIFIVYTGASIAKTFFISASVFGAMSIYGYTTKKDLSGFGTFLIMGLFGIIIASIVNIFLASPALEFAVSILGVLIFVGLTAYDTQKIKQMYFVVGGTGEMAGKAAIMGALSLYMDFINLFLHMLRFIGDRR